MNLLNKLYIDGDWVDARNGALLDVVDPASEEIIHQVSAAGSDDIELAVSAAKRAFDRGWGNTTGQQRAVYLRAFAEVIEARKQDLAQMEVLDNGKPLPEAIWDIEDTAACFSYYADLAEQLDARQGTPVELPDDDFISELRFQPVGVVGQIIPWNFPMLMAAWKVAPALAAGTTIVLKPSELTPLTALEMGRIADDIGLPAGVLNIVTGTGAEAGQPLTEHPLVNKLAFTGSVPTGAKIMAAAASDIKNISLELGGKSAFIIFDDASIEAAVEWVMFGIFWNQGQVCSATSRVLVQQELAEKFLACLKQEARKISIGKGMEEGVLLGPLVSESQYQKVLGFIQRAEQKGLQPLTGGKRPQGLTTGYFLEPTVFADVPLDSELWCDEIFGPVVCVNRFETEEEAVALANNSEFGLAAAVMSKDKARCARVANALDAGIIWVNCSQPTFVEAPWGGTKKSGIGRELGEWGFNNYLETKQITRYVGDQPWGWYLKD